MTETAFVQRLIQALSQPTAPAGAPAMVASYSPKVALRAPAPQPPAAHPAR